MTTDGVHGYKADVFMILHLIELFATLALPTRWIRSAPIEPPQLNNHSHALRLAREDGASVPGSCTRTRLPVPLFEPSPVSKSKRLERSTPGRVGWDGRRRSWLLERAISLKSTIHSGPLQSNTRVQFLGLICTHTDFQPFVGLHYDYYST